MPRLLILLLALMLALPGLAQGRSALSARHTGMDPPGGPKQAPMPTMGYTDAYGNGLTDKVPEAKKQRHRPRPGAYGGPIAKESQATLPDTSANGEPVWKFR